MIAAALAAMFALGAGHHVRLFATHPIDAINTQVARALIVIHGSGRNAEHALDSARAAAARAGAGDDTLIIAPRFSSSDGQCADAIERGEANWGCEANNGWQAGGTASGDDALTSFDVVDRLVQQLARKDLFPRLTTVVIAGHSAGGQFVTRYSMANRIHDTAGVSVSYVVGSPSSFAYPDSGRPASPGSPAAGCSIYDDWPYGLRDRKGYAARLSPEQLARQLATRPITYLLGALDNTAMRGLDTSCAAMAQGGSRLERGEVFARYVNRTFGAHHHVVVVPGCAHDDRCVLTAAAALPVLFPARERGTLRP
jgi:hypothetical protein